MARYVFAMTSGWLHDDNGIGWQVHANQPWDADDPLVKRHPEAFTDTPTVVGRTRQFVEQATRSPGEVRGPRGG